MSIIEHIPCPALVLDMETWRPVEFSSLASNLLRYSREEFARLTISDFEFVPNPSETREHIEQLRRTRGEEFERVHRTKDGRPVRMRIRLNVVRLGERDAMLTLWDPIPAASESAARPKAIDPSAKPNVIAASSRMKNVLQLADKIAKSDVPVLILGETGTGKDLIAQRIHAMSPRRSHVFMPINCASLPAELVDGELFGVERGAFTGADRRRAGRFETAAGGTVFLDEVGELPLGVQAKLLRFLQDGEVHRLGAAFPQRIDTRILAATNQDLPAMVAAGGFRKDLYYRLAGITLVIPPLRDRLEDVDPLVECMLAELKPQLSDSSGFEERDRQRLRDGTWPGNVRELRQVIEASVALSGDGPLSLEMPRTGLGGRLHSPSQASLDCATGSFILSALEACSWIVEGPDGAASRLGLKPSTLRSKMARLGLKRSE